MQCHLYFSQWEGKVTTQHTIIIVLLPQSEPSAAYLILVLSCLFMIEKYGANRMQQVTVVAQLLLQKQNQNIKRFH